MTAAKTVVLLSCHVPHTDTHTQFHANVLARNGYQVLVVAPGSSAITGFDPGVRIKSLPIPRTFFFYNRGLHNTVVAALERLRNTFRANRVLQHLDGCAVCVCTGIDAWFIGLRLKRTHRWKVVGDLREVYEDRLILLPRFMRPLATTLFRQALRFLCRNSDNLIHVSPVRQSFYSYLPKRGVIVRMMPNLADYTWDLDQRRQHGLMSAVHAGPLRTSYASNQLLQAMDILLANSVAVRLTVIGGVQGILERQDVLDRLVRCGCIEILPIVPLATVRSVLSRSDVGISLVLPVDATHSYPEPRKLYEYLAAGLPVVATDAPTINTVIDDWHCGITVDAAQPEAIANALMVLAGDPAMRYCMSRNARAAAEHTFNSHREAHALTSMMSTLLGKA